MDGRPEADNEILKRIPEPDWSRLPAHSGPPPPHAEILREQFDYLLDHVSGGFCGCAECLRYLKVESALLEIFDDGAPPRPRPARRRSADAVAGNRPPVSP